MDEKITKRKSMKNMCFFFNGRIDITVQKAIVEKYKWRSRHTSQLGYFLQGPTTTHEKEKKKSLEGLVSFFSFNCCVLMCAT